MRSYDIILSALKPRPLTFQEVVRATGLSASHLSGLLSVLRRSGQARLIEGRPNLWAYLCDRPPVPFGRWSRFRKRREHWVRIYEACGTLYPEQHSQRLRDRIEWAMIAEYGYIEEPLGVESIEVDGSMGSGDRASSSLAETKPWQRTREQLAGDEARIRAAHSLDRWTARARRLGGLKQVYLDTVSCGVPSNIVLSRMGVQTVFDLEDLDRARAFVSPPPLPFVPARSRPPKRRPSMQAVTAAWLRIVDQQLSQSITRVFKKRVNYSTMYMAIYVKKTHTTRDFPYLASTTKRICRGVRQELAFRRRLLEYIANGSPFHQVGVGILGLDKQVVTVLKLRGIETLVDLMLFTAKQLGPHLMHALQPRLDRLNLTLPVAELVYSDPPVDQPQLKRA